MTPHCPACMHDEELRKEWGCDADASDPVLFITCAYCSGYDPACSTCGGTGEQPIYRCPQSHTSWQMMELFQAYADFVDHGMWPVGTHRSDQSIEFLEFLHTVSSEKAKLEKEMAADG